MAYIKMLQMVRVFDGVKPDKEQAKKVLEEAAEVFGAWQAYDDRGNPFSGSAEERNLLAEIADVIQASLNLAASLGCTSLAAQMLACEKRNRERGRYGDDDSCLLNLSSEDNMAAEWVRENGGLDFVEAVWDRYLLLANDVIEALWPDAIPDDCSNEHVMDELHKRLMPCGYEWNDSFARAVEFFETMHDLLYTVDCEEEHDGPEMVQEVMRRLMPEGMEWPHFEDGKPVLFGDVVSDGDETGRVYYVTFDTVNPVIIGFTDGTPDQDPGTWIEVSVSDGERVKRPAPKVLDADGAEIEVGDDLYSVEGMLKFHVSAIDKKSGRIATEAMFALDKWADPKMYTHRAPVLAADGRPLREGEHVYHVETGAELVVKELPKPGAYQAVVVFAPPASHFTSFDPDQLTHERPVNHCFECSHWQVEPGRDRLGVCWDTYGERECEDSYAAVLGTSEACAQFERRAKARGGGAERKVPRCLRGGLR